MIRVLAVGRAPRVVRLVGAFGLTLALVLSLLPLAAESQESFDDIADNPHAAAIEYLKVHEVTMGCNPPNNHRFCPDRSLTRGEMAVFLSKAFDLPASEDDHFGDDEGIFESAIDSVAAADITRGCNPPDNDRFCPHDRVTRGEMAAFLTRALGLSPGEDRFSDDERSVFEADIDAVSRVGISLGCNPPTNDAFCPDRSVTRAEMATFVMRSMEIERTGTTTTTKRDTPRPPDVEPPTDQQCDVAMRGPANPEGDVRVERGESIDAAIDRAGEGATIVIAAGVHRPGDWLSPDHRQHIVGEPGAVLDGEGSTEFAFGGSGDHVTIEGLEIRNYASDVTEGAVRSYQGSHDWVIRANEIHHNGGQGIKFSQGWTIVGNHIHHNQQYGIGGSGDDVIVERNELSYNNHDMGESAFNGAGGTKFVRTENLVVRNNCSHHNGGPGLWTDGHNVNTRYEGNLVFDNEHAGIKHEVSCAATIVGNTALRNGFGNENWLAGAGIVVLNSPGVTIRNNRVEGNADGIAGIQGDRGSADGVNCQLLLKDLVVEDNDVSMSDGYTGIVTNHTSDVFDTWNNEFRQNSYDIPSGKEFFHWEGDTLTYSEWQNVHGRD